MGENTRDGISLWGKEDRPQGGGDDEELKKALQHWGGGVLKHMGAKKALPPPRGGKDTDIDLTHIPISPPPPTSAARAVL